MCGMTLSLNPFAADGNFGQYDKMIKSRKMTETLAHGYIYDSAPQEFLNEYQLDRV